MASRAPVAAEGVVVIATAFRQTLLRRRDRAGDDHVAGLHANLMLARAERVRNHGRPPDQLWHGAQLEHGNEIGCEPVACVGEVARRRACKARPQFPEHALAQPFVENAPQIAFDRRDEAHHCAGDRLGAEVDVVLPFLGVEDGARDRRRDVVAELPQKSFHRSAYGLAMCGAVLLDAVAWMRLEDVARRREEMARIVRGLVQRPVPAVAGATEVPALFRHAEPFFAEMREQRLDDLAGFDGQLPALGFVVARVGHFLRDEFVDGLAHRVARMFERRMRVDRHDRVVARMRPALVGLIGLIGIEAEIENSERPVHAR